MGGEWLEGKERIEVGFFKKNEIDVDLRGFNGIECNWK